MPLLNRSERRFAGAVAELGYCNPFLPERIELERKALGREFRRGSAVWSMHPEREGEGETHNITRLAQRCEKLSEDLRARLADGAQGNEAELLLYEDVVLYMLYHRYRSRLQETIAAAADDTDGANGKAAAPRRVPFWRLFRDDFRHFLRIPKVNLPTELDPAHLFACFFQLRRAFHHVFHFIVGGSMPAARLRAAVWQSIFTHDMRRYRRSLFRRMGDVTTLVTGPSGTGKELVARAIGLSRYIPFDAKGERLATDFAGSFHALNLSALSPTLIESELFGHRRGAFTGAVDDRAGWLEVCGPLGTVFLDEIGELDPAIQVKLLRVFQARTFAPLGDTQDRRFEGKIIAATNRDLAAQIRDGRFRQDFYYRLCSDIITTPTLREQLADSPSDLHRLILFIALRVADPDEAAALAAEVREWIDKHLGGDYAWPGNIRELEQCLRNVMIRRQYEPAIGFDGGPREPAAQLAAAIEQGSLTADELLRRYCTIVFAQTGSYEQAARRLKLDRRTVKAKIDREMLSQLTGEAGGAK